MTITANDASRSYGTDNPVFTARYTGLVGGDDPSVVRDLRFSTAATLQSNVGSYNITPYGARTVSANFYSISYVPGVLTINPADLYVRSNDVTRTYGVAAPSFLFGATVSSGLRFWDNFNTSDLTYSTTNTDTTNVGVYPITVQTQVRGNYRVLNDSARQGSLTVTPASLSVMADNALRAYGDPNPVFSYRVNGLLNGDAKPTVSLTSEATPASNVGSYAISLSGITTSNPNYVVDRYVAGTLSVEPLKIRVDGGLSSSIYGDKPAPVLTYTTVNAASARSGAVGASEVAPGVTVSASTTATDRADVGTYSVTPVVQGSAGNNVVVVPGYEGQHTITPLSVPVTFYLSLTNLPIDTPEAPNGSKGPAVTRDFIPGSATFNTPRTMTVGDPYPQIKFVDAALKNGQHVSDFLAYQYYLPTLNMNLSQASEGREVRLGGLLASSNGNYRFSADSGTERWDFTLFRRPIMLELPTVVLTRNQLAEYFQAQEMANTPWKFGVTPEWAVANWKWTQDSFRTQVLNGITIHNLVPDSYFTQVNPDVPVSVGWDKITGTGTPTPAPQPAPAPVTIAASPVVSISTAVTGVAGNGQLVVAPPPLPNNGGAPAPSTPAPAANSELAMPPAPPPPAPIARIRGVSIGDIFTTSLNSLRLYAKDNNDPQQVLADPNIQFSTSTYYAQQPTYSKQSSGLFSGQSLSSVSFQVLADVPPPPRDLLGKALSGPATGYVGESNTTVRGAAPPSGTVSLTPTSQAVSTPAAVGGTVQDPLPDSATHLHLTQRNTNAFGLTSASDGVLGQALYAWALKHNKRMSNPITAQELRSWYDEAGSNPVFKAEIAGYLVARLTDIATKSAPTSDEQAFLRDFETYADNQRRAAYNFGTQTLAQAREEASQATLERYRRAQEASNQITASGSGTALLGLFNPGTLEWAATDAATFGQGAGGASAPDPSAVLGGAMASGMAMAAGLGGVGAAAGASAQAVVAIVPHALRAVEGVASMVGGAASVGFAAAGAAVGIVAIGLFGWIYKLARSAGGTDPFSGVQKQLDAMGDATRTQPYSVVNLLKGNDKFSLATDVWKAGETLEGKRGPNNTLLTDKGIEQLTQSVFAMVMGL